jgi:hypothetical protein
MHTIRLEGIGRQTRAARSDNHLNPPRFLLARVCGHGPSHPTLAPAFADVSSVRSFSVPALAFARVGWLPVDFARLALRLRFCDRHSGPVYLPIQNRNRLAHRYRQICLHRPLDLLPLECHAILADRFGIPLHAWSSLPDRRAVPSAGLLVHHGLHTAHARSQGQLSSLTYSYVRIISTKKERTANSSRLCPAPRQRLLHTRSILYCYTYDLCFWAGLPWSHRWG